MKQSRALRTIAVTGASGFVGRALTEALLSRGYRVVALGRKPEANSAVETLEWRRFDPNDPSPNPSAFEGCDGVVHLAGETVDGRWTPQKKRAIYKSRIEGTRSVVASLRACAASPSVLVCASATGYYGDRADQPLDERSSAGNDFLAHVCSDWEREAREADEICIRSVQMRTGIVLGTAGALRKMATPFRFGLGGPMGSGRQFVPWIHIDDLTALYIHAIENAEIIGPVNAVAPDYATSARFSQALGAALRRPAILPAPPFALRAVLGEFSQTLLGGQLVIPAVAQDSQFSWHHDNLERALFHIFARADEPALLWQFCTEQRLPVPLEAVFPFFAEAQNLQAITPPALDFCIRSVSGVLQRGATIEYTMRLHGIPFSWKTMIARWEPPYRFDDVQLHGPYALWHHRHEFEPHGDGVIMRDHVLYALPLQPFGNVALPIVQSDVRSIFAFRAEAVTKLVRSLDGAIG